MYNKDHSLYHFTIKTFFALNQLISLCKISQFLFKNVKVKKKIFSNFTILITILNELDLYSIQLVEVIELAIIKHIPLAKPNLYIK